jgi:site-specific recombinase XerD
MLSETWLDQLSAERTLLKLPKDFVLHSLRHTRLGESGADAFTIMKLIEGHSSVTVSQRYVHPSPESVERAVAGLEGQNVAEWQKVGIESVIPNVRQYSRPH